MVEDQIARRTLVIRRVYLGLACFNILSFISDFSRLKGAALERSGESIIFILIYCTIYAGLKKQRKWVIPLILITSISALMQTLFAIMEPALNITILLAKIVWTLILFFYWYQAVFFSRTEVKKFFGSKGTILF